MASQADDQVRLMEAVLTMREVHSWSDEEIAAEVETVLEG